MVSVTWFVFIFLFHVPTNDVKWILLNFLLKFFEFEVSDLSSILKDIKIVHDYETYANKRLKHIKASRFTILITLFVFEMIF